MMHFIGTVLLTLVVTATLPPLAATAQQTLPAEKVAALKSATVFITATSAGRRGSGSGFVIKQKGDDTYILTNDHVVNPDHNRIVRGTLDGFSGNLAVKVVFDSGTLQERAADAAVVAFDPERDLAVLKVSGLKTPPTPIDYTKPATPVELMPLAILGYPLGKATAVADQNPSCTVTTSSVSNIRTNLRTGRMQDIQVNGGMAPGNSGGPVVSATDGKLVGVSVSGFGGTAIAYAVPAAEVNLVLAGAAGKVTIKPRTAVTNTSPADFRVRLIDPLKSIRKATAWVRTDWPAEKPKPGVVTKLEGSEKIELTIADGSATGTVASPPVGTMVVQVELETENGKVLAPAAEVRITAAILPDPPGFLTPLPKVMAEDLRRTGPMDEKYPLPQDDAQAKKLRSGVEAWYTAQLVTPFLAGPKMTDEARKLTETALKTCVRFRTFQWWSPYGSASVYIRNEQLGKAVTAGSKDPTLLFFNAQLVRRPVNPREDAQEFQRQRQAVRDAKLPVLVQMLADLHFAQVLRQQKDTDGAKEAFGQAIQTLATLMNDPAPAAQREAYEFAIEIEAAYEDASWGREEAWRQIDAAARKAKVPASVLDTLRGDFLINFAWDARGGGVGLSVPLEKLALFKDRLRQAEASFDAAYAADPANARASTRMIVVCMGLGHPRDIMENWFRRAMTADPDNYAACTAKHNYLSPRWHGKENEAAHFARQCLRSGNFHSGLATMIVYHYRGLYSEQTFAAQADDIAWADLREFHELFLKNGRMHGTIMGDYMMLCAARNHWTAANTLLAKYRGVTKSYPKPTFSSQAEFDAFAKRIEQNAAKASETKQP